MVDTPHCCSYIVPAVVDRAPLQIAISSAGTAPVLARHWRQQIELLLPRHTGALAALAGRFRARVKEAVRGTEARRRFWERLFASRFDTLVAQNRLAEAEAEIARQLAAQPAQRGEVALVGAGPGDAGLLTLHALQAMQAADVVFYDALVSDDIRALIRKDATQISVGKRAGAAQVAQGEIHELLIRHARAGQRVVRLKGGDPFVFGRGGEEAQALQAAGIPCRIIPGITAALGATAYAGIPLTHREHAQAVTFITGHGKGDRDLHWPTLAQRRHTLVVYMGTLTAATLQQQLLAHGRAAQTPVAVISHGTRAEQQVRVGTLARLAELAQEAPTPALLVIGETVALHAQLAWFGTRAERAA